MNATKAVPSARWTVGSQWLSVSMSARAGLYRIIPAAPPCRTLKPFSTRALTPRWQATILPVKMPGGAGASHSGRLYGASDGQDDRQGRVDTGRDRRALRRERVAVAGGHGQGRGELTGLGGRGHGHDPRREVVGGRRTGAVVAGRGRHEDARGVGVEEGELDRVRERIRAARDREVDDVDAVEDRLLDRGGRVGVEAAPDAADLVDGQPGAGGDAVDRTALDAEDRRRRQHVAGRGGCGVRAVAVRVTGRLVRLGGCAVRARTGRWSGTAAHR